MGASPSAGTSRTLRQRPLSATSAALLASSRRTAWACPSTEHPRLRYMSSRVSNASQFLRCMFLLRPLARIPSATEHSSSAPRGKLFGRGSTSSSDVSYDFDGQLVQTFELFRGHVLCRSLRECSHKTCKVCEYFLVYEISPED